jgi:antitoxin (DNA-binding transcriptional repressor) of toxin-antitoxin stability system
MKMKELEQLQSFTIQQFQEDFDALMERVENGESFIIKDGKNSAVIVPYNETILMSVDSIHDDIVKIHTDHEEAS